MRKKLTQLAAVLALTTITTCRDPSALMNLYGFTALRPPSNLYQAGAVVVVNYATRDGQNVVDSLKLVCGPRASLGSEWMPMESATLTAMHKIASKQTFHLESEALSKIRANAKFEDVQDVVIELSNARIVELQDIDIWENLAFRSEACRNAIVARINQGFDVTIVSSNIIADIIYNVKFRQDRSMDKKMQLDKMKALAVNLGGGHTYVDESSIHAKNLAVGIKTDAFLLAISMPNSCQERLMQRGSRHLDASVADADASEADAPIVHPNSSILGTRKRVGKSKL